MTMARKEPAWRPHIITDRNSEIVTPDTKKPPASVRVALDIPPGVGWDVLRLPLRFPRNRLLRNIALT